jgi:hypothetical protein
LTCTTLGPTSAATRATGSSAGMREVDREEAWDETFGEASATLSFWDAGCSREHPASSTVPSKAASKAAHALDLQFNVPDLL